MNTTKIVVFTNYYFLEVAKILRVRVIKSIQKKEDEKMLQTNLKVVAVGKPNVEALTDGEKRTFFESIFSMIVELHKQMQTENKNGTWLKSRKNYAKKTK